MNDSGRINKAIGSLGGGNHFIELDKNDEDNVYLVIHTGSCNLGKQVAEIYQAKAVKHLTDGADEFESVHNYISDDNIIRKGSISAAEGERCIIPLNMRDGSLLCTGNWRNDWI